MSLYSDLRQNLAHYVDTVVNNRDLILVTRQGGKGNVVILFEEEFAGWQEMVHLMSSPANAQHLLRSVRSAEAGEAARRDLVPAQAAAAG